MKLGLAVLFFLIAMIYASVGFGGGSSYTAILAVSAISYQLIPVIALICNICVVSGNSWRYSRAGLINLRATWPLFLISVPAAWLGGALHVSELVFIGLLSAALMIAGLRLLISKESDQIAVEDMPANFMALAFMGGLIGFYSGLVGIGGGIFLAPVLYYLKWGSAQTISALCSVFILVNSLSGLFGHLSKFQASEISTYIWPFWPLILAVIIGGLLGNYLGLKVFSQTILRRLTGILVLAVALRLSYRWVDLMGWSF